jgi:hypothetical protein
MLADKGLRSEHGGVQQGETKLEPGILTMKKRIIDPKDKHGEWRRAHKRLQPLQLQKVMMSIVDHNNIIGICKKRVYVTRSPIIFRSNR